MTMNVFIGLIILVIALIGTGCAVANILWDDPEYKYTDYSKKDDCCGNCKHYRRCQPPVNVTGDL